MQKVYISVPASYIAGELELPLSTVLLVTCAPYQFIMNLRYETFSAYYISIIRVSCIFKYLY